MESTFSVIDSVLRRSTTMAVMKSMLMVILVQLCFSAEVYGKDKVKLKDISTLTLHSGKWTTGRRSQPVPQMQCIGGTAGCSSNLLPKTVQCYNRGSDGVDVQWECKADLPEGLQFGELDVVCEGYDYPDDPYILKGSCGLEYKLESRSGSSSKTYSQSSSEKINKTTKERGGFGDLVIFAIVAIIIYALYKTCLTNNQTSPTEGDYPGGTPYPQGYQGGFPSAPAPPPSYSYPDYGDGCSGDRTFYSRGNRRSGGGAGNFWTGAATGGILGYLFGSRGSSSGSTSSRREYQSPNTSGTTFSNDSSSSSTYTATGFGGTRRR